MHESLPTLADIEAARSRISALARLTPVLRDEALDDEIGRASCRERVLTDV
mgnify:CR=1 FL=1